MDPSRPETAYAPVTIPALGPSMGEDLPDRFLCPVRALRYYLKLKHKGLDPNNRFRRLLCAFKLGHIGDISKQTVSGWIRQLFKQAYSAVQDEDIPHLTHTNFQARELRAFASSLAFHQNYSLKQVMEAASWRNNNTFVSFYLRDLSQMGMWLRRALSWLVRMSYPADQIRNRATWSLLAAFPLLPPSRSGGHCEQWDPLSPSGTLAESGTEDSTLHSE